MSTGQSINYTRGSSEHAEALKKVDDLKLRNGLTDPLYKEAAKELEALQRKIKWQTQRGVIASAEVDRDLCMQTLNDRFSSIDQGKAELFSWSKIKQRLVSHEFEKKDEARLFLLTKFYSDGFAERSFSKRDYGALTCGISRCKNNVEWIDGLILDFDADVTVDQFCQKYGSYEYILYSSFNHDPDQGKHKFRVVMPLKKPVRGIELEERKSALLELFEGVDPASFRLGQPFYLPSHRKGTEPVRVENDGELFDLMALEVNVAPLQTYSSSIKVTADGNAAEIIAAIMNCMPPDTEYFRQLPGTNGHTYDPVIVPFISSMGYWGKENGLDEDSICQLIEQRWASSKYADNFYRLVAKAHYGGLEAPMAFVERVGQAIRGGLDLGIIQSDFKQSRDHLYKLLDIQTVAQHQDVIDIDTASHKLRLLLLQRMYEYGMQNSYRNHLIVRYEAGAGKTQNTHDMLWIGLLSEKPKRQHPPYWVVDYLTPDHALGAEITKRLKEADQSGRLHIQHIKGRKELCIDEKVKQAEELGYAVSDPCEGCTHKEKCEYPKQYQLPTDKHLVRVIYNGMVANQKAKFDPVEGPDFYIVDEDMVASLYEEDEFGHEYKFVKELSASITPQSTSSEIANAIRSKLTAEVNELNLSAAQTTPLPGVAFKNFRNDKISLDEFKKQLVAKDKKKKTTKPKRSAAACRSLLDDLTYRPQAISVREGADGARKVISSRLKPLASRYAKAPCIYLDATGEQAVIERALKDRDGNGRAADYWERSVAYSKSVKVYQDTSRSWSMSSLCPKTGGKAVVNEELLRVVWDEIVRRSILTGTKFAIITYKDVATYINSRRTPPGCLDIINSPYFCGVGHFGNIRGKDCFNQDGVQHLYVIGRMKVSSDTVEKYARAIFSRDIDPLAFSTHKVRVKVGTEVELEDTQYTDKRVQAVSNMLNSAETAQAAHRLRLIHGDTPKELFLITNAVLPIRVNEGIILGKSLTKKDAKLLELRAALSNGQCAVRTAKSWSAWPACLDGVDDRMSRELLSQAEDEQNVSTYQAFNYITRKADRKKRDGLILGENKEVCEAFLAQHFAGELVEHISDAAKKSENPM